MSAASIHEGIRAREESGPDLGFNAWFLVLLLACSALSVFTLLYLNRVFASIVSYAIRTWTWHKYRIYIDIAALQISLLGGRVFFTGLRYHGSNESFYVQHGYITWAYWLRRVRDVDINVSDNPNETAGVDKDKNSTLPCRIGVNLNGLEWFVYNRTPIYDNILAGLTGDSASATGVDDRNGDVPGAGLRERTSRTSSDDPKTEQAPGTLENQTPGEPDPARLDETRTASSADAPNEETPAIPLLLQLFPISIECHKAAVVVGNENTKAVLIVKADSITGEVDASKTEAPDPYRQVFKVQFQHPVLEIRDNGDFKEDQVARETRERGAAGEAESPSKKSLFRHQRRKFLASLQHWVPYWHKSVESFTTGSRPATSNGASQIPNSRNWQGLSRYLNDRDQGDKSWWSSVEYAAVPTIVDSPAASLTVYWDVVGKVAETPRTKDASEQNINGQDPPAWGMHLSLRGGTVNYGPWADRHRADLQRVFFPSLCKDAVPAKPLPPGSWRVPTQFKFFVEILESVTVRVPIREESKNWRYSGTEPEATPVKPVTKRKQRSRAKENAQGEATQSRPSGWLEIKVPVNTTVTLAMDSFANSAGYGMFVNVDFPAMEISSSVNHDLLARSGPQRISCDLSSPLKWNALRNWQFEISGDGLELFLLRDHMFLMVDLVNDWASGPPSEYLVFTPFLYHLRLHEKNMKLYLNVNDGNIIDKASELGENSYIVLGLPSLKVGSTIPLDNYSPLKNKIPFDIRAQGLQFSFQAPQWNTMASFIAGNELGHAEGLTVTGSYEYNTTTSPANTDTLILQVHAQSPQVYLYGFLIRFVMVLKEDYFGEHVHFRTFDEYQKQLQGDHQAADGVPIVEPQKKSNDLDVILGAKVDDPRIILPTNIYASDRYVECELASLSVDLRFTDYYMDVELELSPLNLSLRSSMVEPGSPDIATSSTQLFIDGLRLYGHRLFGLPPTTQTYLCNWDLSVGAISGEATADFLSALVGGGGAFIFTFDDVENALVPYSSLVFHDATFIRLAVQSVHIWVHIDEAAFLLSTGKITVDSNDWANSHYSKRANVSIPALSLSWVDADSINSHKARHRSPPSAGAFLRTDINLAVVGRKFHFSEQCKIQQELFRQEDQRTHRTDFLLRPLDNIEFVPQQVDPPAQCIPTPPPPITELENSGGSIYSLAPSRMSHRITRPRSFLSVSSASSNGSIRRSKTLSGLRSRQASTTGASQPLLSRDHTRPSNQHSARHSIRDYRPEESAHHSRVAFSSLYHAPYFALDSSLPDHLEESHRNAQSFPSDLGGEEFEASFASLEDLDPDILSEDHAHNSILVEFVSGITVVANPAVVQHMTSLLEAIQPKHPEDILDSLQTGTITDIFDAQKQEHVTGEITDLLVRLPQASVRFLNSSILDSPDPSQEEQDQYDITISQVALMMRTTKTWEDKSNEESKNSRTSVHLRTKSIELSASERLSSIQEPQAAVTARVEDIMVYVGAKEVTYLDVDIGAVIGSTVTGKVEYLAALVHRTENVASELGKHLAKATKTQSDRLKYLVCQLLEMGSTAIDPSFLIRPSTVLRSAPKHIRTVDSWKMAMRLQKIWRSLSEGSQARLVGDLSGDSLPLPPDGLSMAVAAFQKWRSWDLENPAGSTLLRKVFGHAPTPEDTPANQTPFLGACRLGELRFVLDPNGPRGNKIAFTDMNGRFDTKPAVAGNGLLGTRDLEGLLTTINICCGDASVHLNWELCELVDDILRLRARAPLPTISAAAPPSSLSEPPASRIAFHVVTEIIRGSVETETINLKSRALSDGLRGSFLVCGAEDGVKLSSSMLNCKAVTTRLHSHSQLLGTMRINEPSIFVSYEIPEPRQPAAGVLNFTASSQSLDLDIQQDIIVLMESFDLVVRDEVAQIHRMQAHLPASAPEEKPVEQSPSWLSHARVNLAVFLDQYSISIPLVQPLTYKISGVVARAACRLKFGNEILFDFDIKDNTHEMQVNVQNKPKRISLLHIPPTNGHITSHSQDSYQVLTVLTSVERVSLDASSVYSLLAALNRPQISSAIKEIQQQAQIIQDHVSDIFGSDKTPEPKAKETSKLNIVYNIQTTYGGLEILAKTSLKSEAEPTAQVLFSLDRVYLQSSNRHEPQGPILTYPEVHLNLNKIGIDIQRGRADLMRSCGSLSASVTVAANSTTGKDGKEDWSFSFKSDDLDVNLSPETVSTVVDVLGYLGDKIKDLDTSRELEYLRKLRQSKPRIMLNDQEEVSQDSDILDSVLSSVIYRFELRNIQVTWDVSNDPDEQDSDNVEDMVLSINLIEFGTRTKSSARLLIEHLQLQTVPAGQNRSIRSLHSALLPQVIFNIGYVSGPGFRRMAFQAVGQSLDLRLTSGFIVPAAYVFKSISLSMKNVQQASAQWNTNKPATEKVESTPQPERQQSHSFFGNKRLESLLIDADFAGAVVYVSGKQQKVNDGVVMNRSLGGKYGQFFADDSGSAAILKSPGLAWKAEYQDNGHEDPCLYGEIKVDASNNTLYPSVVPLILEIVSSVKEVVSDDPDEPLQTPVSPKAWPENAKPTDEDNILTADPSAVLGRLKLNLGLRICRQVFTLSCQPIAHVAATTRFESVYFTVNTVHSQELGNFFAISGTLTKPEASVQHVYSRESTGSFEIDTVTLSFLNSKHVSGTPGVSAILNISPMKLSINAKQVQDFLLFREIWYPKELRRGSSAPVAKIVTETSQSHLVQRYQQVAATTAFPWTATISIASLDVSVDFGQAIGRSVFEITNLWVSSKKTSDWEQNLCLGFGKMGMDCTGRLSGSVSMQDFKLRSSIQWPRREEALNETPLVQASMIFHAFRVKAAFDYQAFLIADISTLEFMMYNVREGREGSGDRLVAIFDGDAVQVFGTTTSAAQAVALYQAFKKLMQEKKESFESSLRDIEKFKKRRSSTNRGQTHAAARKPKLPEDDTLAKSPISLDTDVVVTLKALNLGVFPSTFSDHQVLKMEAHNAYARFAASVEQRRIHSLLRMTLGQLRIGLAGVRDAEAPKTLSEISVADVVQRATGSRGGTILRVPRVAATMETWQKPDSNHIDYIFKSAFEGKVEVGWNYSRISFIRGMWANHTKSLEQIWGHELPMTAVKITGVPEGEGESMIGQQQKITAEVNVPQSRFEYNPLEPAVIETPQLRDMGEATPPLEWIGLHREKLPNLTHQIVIVALLELAGEVEDAYSRILGA
jgi:hypothetical protein